MGTACGVNFHCKCVCDEKLLKCCERPTRAACKQFPRLLEPFRRISWNESALRWPATARRILSLKTSLIKGLNMLQQLLILLVGNTQAREQSGAPQRQPKHEFKTDPRLEPITGCCLLGGTKPLYALICTLRTRKGPQSTAPSHGGTLSKSATTPGARRRLQMEPQSAPLLHQI